MTAAKQYWLHESGPRRAWTTEHQPVSDAYDQQIGMSPPRSGPGRYTYRDDPTTEVVDMRDLILPENAISLRTCPRLLTGCGSPTRRSSSSREAGLSTG